MPDERRKPDVEHFSTKEKLLEDLGKALIGDLLKQRAAAIAALDEKLATLGHPANSARAKRSHHKKPAPPAPDALKAATKPAA